MAVIAKALGDPIRLQLVDVLRKHAGEVCVCELTPLFDVGQPTVSHHLKVLRKAGIVDSERRGLWAYYYVLPEALEELLMAERPTRRSASWWASGRPRPRRGGAGVCPLRGWLLHRPPRTSGLRRRSTATASRTSCPDRRAASLGCGSHRGGRPARRARSCSTSARAAASTRSLGAAGGPDGKRLRHRHDRRDARARSPERRPRPASTNVEFSEGAHRGVPAAGGSVDVVISNCVINLSADKPRCCARPRACWPGGRFGLRDVVADPDLDDATRADIEPFTPAAWPAP